MPIFITELSLRLTYFYTSNVQLALRSPFIPSQYTAFHHLRLSVKLIIGITCSSSSVYSHFITLKYKCQYFFTFLFIFSKTFQKLFKNSSKQNILTRKTPNQYNCSGVFLFLLLLCKFFFCKSCKCCETFFIIYCKLSKHLSVNINVCQF